MMILDPSDENVNLTEGIPRGTEDPGFPGGDFEGERWLWLYVNWETESPEAVSEEEAKERDFAVLYDGEERSLQYRRKDKQFLYFKARYEP